LFVDLKNYIIPQMDNKPSLINTEDLHFNAPDGMIVHNPGNDKHYIDPSEYIILNRELLNFSRLKTNSITFKQHPLSNPVNNFSKRAMDLLFGGMITLLVLSWLIPLLALVIKMDSRGPVFFLQKRKKKDGKIFTCIKFRTMFVNGETDILPNCNENRITQVGRVLRRHYIDELPQFINVLKGDMSVIGPRPHMVFENLKYETLVQDYSLRHMIKPGITGLAQVLGYAGSTDLQKIRSRVYLDIHYLQHWSFFLDIRIIWRTLLKISGCYRQKDL
jgi:putative colanic acid biosysnthesis UDP-glucose lipid carrier transferase